MYLHRGGCSREGIAQRGASSAGSSPQGQSRGVQPRRAFCSPEVRVAPPPKAHARARMGGRRALGLAQPWPQPRHVCRTPAAGSHLSTLDEFGGRIVFETAQRFATLAWYSSFARTVARHHRALQACSACAALCACARPALRPAISKVWRGMAGSATVASRGRGRDGRASTRYCCFAAPAAVTAQQEWRFGGRA